MKVTLVPPCVGSNVNHQFLTSYLVNDKVAIDAGCVGFFRSPQEQAQIKDIFISHTHIDHTASLAIFVENAYEASSDCVTIHGSDAVLESLARDVFNDRVWPDFIKLSTDETPFLKLSRLEPGKPVELDGLRVTPVSVNHVVPTFGFLVEDQSSAVVISSDTGPTEEIWKLANNNPKLKGAFVEVTFPNSMSWLADTAKHLTVTAFAQEARKLKRQVLLIAVHIKPRFYAEVVAELQALGLPNVQLGQFGKPYEF
jgi:ribonuclease BN (tRNA processing enzyme)